MSDPGRDLVKDRMRQRRLLAREVATRIEARIVAAVEAGRDPLAAVAGVGAEVAAVQRAALARLTTRGVEVTLGGRA